MRLNSTRKPRIGFVFCQLLIFEQSLIEQRGALCSFKKVAFMLTKNDRLKYRSNIRKRRNLAKSQGTK